ncbi:MAG: ATP-binding cassette domain-containing protein, partial [Microthrixaceae bacterium]|nr:ATP-binding cassette domain-containing protein [Microthrixaceae bacterium]
GSIPPQQGMIAVAGTVIDPDDAKTTRSLSATVAQSTWMFTGTIADNLRMARENATDAELWDALESAQVADEIARMPHGLDTYIGEGAALISGGQAQRISLARALLSGRSVLLLDEPTSQVDIESESKIIDAIASLPTDRTVLMITHRRSLLRIADRVHELTDGRLESVEVAHV